MTDSFVAPGGGGSGDDYGCFLGSPELVSLGSGLGSDAHIVRLCLSCLCHLFLKGEGGCFNGGFLILTFIME